MASKINIAIVGASGYTGLELIKIIINHPQFDITYIANSKGEQKLSSLHPSLQDVFECDYDISKADANEIKSMLIWYFWLFLIIPLWALLKSF